ncbi:hypothetical protein LAZ67_23002259 [Cordylochernes scorpioides]|uniref:Mos1 transposase HTH domain-containing protein n=1 Tax=Cordylochernes scorpioides TaxID=51811 RepID=A0ABY6LR70_9ARAC|nr:hypothetical protein LAZ67_23002259 [Cordylochernes scorpioides]
MLEEVYGDHALSKSQCYRWFKKFQSGDFELDNEPHGKPPQKFEDAELQALLDEDSTQMQEKLAKQLQASQALPPGRVQVLRRLAPLLSRQAEDCLYLNIFAPAVATPLFLIAPSHIFTLRRFNLRRVFLERNRRKASDTVDRLLEWKNDNGTMMTKHRGAIVLVDDEIAELVIWMAVLE